MAVILREISKNNLLHDRYRKLHPSQTTQNYKNKAPLLIFKLARNHQNTKWIFTTAFNRYPLTGSCCKVADLYFGIPTFFSEPIKETNRVGK